MTRQATSPAVAICIVTHDSAAHLPDCLEAIGRLDARVELVIVDCASSDGSAAIARRCAPDGLPVRIVPLSDNAGFAGGMNRALAECSAPFVLTLNPDARPAPDFVGQLLERARSRPRVGAVAGRLTRPGSRRLDACGMRLTLSWRHLDRGSDRLDRGQLRTAERVFGATGAASLFRREALEDVAVGGEVFLSEFHSFREDAELCFRLRERGWEVLYEPRALAVHERRNLPRRRRRMPAPINYHSLKNRYLLRAYHQTWENLLLTLVPALWRDLLALSWVLLAERSSLAAYGWLWRNRRQILARRQLIRGRCLRPSWEINRWFLRWSLPL